MFEVGDVVDALVECSYPDGIGGSRVVNVVYRGTVLKHLSENRVAVRFRIPHQPAERNVCDRCGFPGMLSKNGATGEIVCMRSGCGHDHGFEEWGRDFQFDQLVNITTKMRNEEKTKFNARLAAVLREGVSKGFINIQEVERMLKTGRCLPS